MQTLALDLPATAPPTRSSSVTPDLGTVAGDARHVLWEWSAITVVAFPRCCGCMNEVTPLASPHRTISLFLPTLCSHRGTVDAQVALAEA